MDYVKRFFIWWGAHFNLEYTFVPFGAANVLLKRDGKMYGYRDYYVFGIRLIRLQQTRPWVVGG